MRNTCRALAVMAAALLAPATVASAATLKPPTLNAPGNESTVEASPTLTWNSVKSAAVYEFQLSADRQFGSLAHSVKTKNTAATLKGTLIDGTYYWRVRGVSAGRKAGRWSSVREFNKRWRTGPTLLQPTIDFGAIWPTSPLVFEWSPVAHATSYNVVVATDPSLAQPVLGTVAKPQTTTGTVLAFPGTLNAGTYYWQITPVDSEGHKGTPSTVGRFTWSWPSSLAVTVEDLNPAREVFDPLLRWTDVPGAARYDVEINVADSFAPGSVVATSSVIGNATSPVKQLPNNTYYWRVRAVDTDGRAGNYVTGSFAKEFDLVAPDPTVPGLTINDGMTAVDAAATTETSQPVLTWNPVPGAASYEVAIAPKPGGICDWSAGNVFGSSSTKTAFTANPYMDLAALTGGPNPGIGTSVKQQHKLVDLTQYCARIRAVDGAGNVSQFTYLGGANNVAAFTYRAPAAGPVDACVALPQATYVSPSNGSTLPRTPKFHWNPVDGAKSYYVIVARDASLTNIVEIAFTDRTFYVPRATYEDETTGYYWVVWPSPRTDGGCPGEGTPIRFDKASVPPAQQGPDDGTLIPTQPVFRWASAEGAKDYRIQIARDAEFKDLVDNVVTASTAYAPATTYPVDTQLHWRVRARDVDNIELAWSPVRSFRRTLPTPVVDPSNPRTGSSIPVLAWDAVPGAVSYGFHVDRVDGGTEDFTVATPRFSPTKFYGNGIWKWKVRANFPASSGSVSGPYTGTTDYIRRILPPTNTRAVRTSKRLVFSWNPDQSGKKYRLEVAKDDSFTDKMESVTTPNTSYAPLLDSSGYVDGGKLFWRVAIVDDGGNVGAFARGDLRLPPRLVLKTGKVGSFNAGRRTAVVITVTDPRGTKIRNATVKFSGAGVKGRRRTGKKGTVTLRIRAKKRGTVKITASRKGYVTGTLNVGAY